MQKQKNVSIFASIMSTVILSWVILLAVILIIAGIAGTFLPALPGPPLSWAGLLVVYLAFPPYVSGMTLWSLLVLTAIAQVLDYMAPIWMTKAGGGSKAAITGSTVGLIIGLFFMPIGLILGPIVGAFLGEMSSTHEIGRATRMALLSFLSFILTTGLKLVLCLLMAFYSILAICQYLF